MTARAWRWVAAGMAMRAVDLEHLPPRLLLCDAALIDAPACHSLLRRVDAAGVLVRLIDADGSVPPDRAAIGRPAAAARPAAGEVSAHDPLEVRPAFIVRVCRALGIDTTACVVLSGRRTLIAAADAAGARAVMVPTAATPPFHVRALPHVAPDLPTALELVLAW